MLLQVQYSVKGSNGMHGSKGWKCSHSIDSNSCVTEGSTPYMKWFKWYEVAKEWMAVS